MNSEFYEWRDAVASPLGPSKPVTRHLLLTVALFMDADGSGAYPSYELLAERTGLSRRSVVTHMNAAVEEGWLERDVRGRNGQGWRLFEYSIALPPAVAQKVESARAIDSGTLERGERDAPRSSLSHVNQSGKGSARDAPRNNKRGANHAERGANERKNVVQEVHTISPIDLSIDLLGRTSYEKPTLGKTDAQLSEARGNVRALIDRMKGSGPDEPVSHANNSRVATQA